MRTESRGFVLPTTLMVMALLTVMLTAAFILISAEYRTTDNALAMSRAHAIAQAGLENYMSRYPSITPTSTYDSVHVVFGSGYAEVVAQRLVASSGSHPTLWLIRSTGVQTAGGTLTGQTTGRRVVAQLAVLNPGKLPLKSAFVAANPLVVAANGGNPISGDDACLFNVDTAGLTIAAGDLSGSGVQGGIRTLPSRATVLDSTHVDWASLLAGNFTPDYVVPPWPAPSLANRVYYAPGDLTLPTGTRWGVLVVQGDLTLGSGGATEWDGIILVGGRIIEAGGSITVHGSVTTGLNNLINPNSVPPDSVNQAGNSEYRWDSCWTALQQLSMGSLSPLRNGFINTWSTY